MNETQRIPPAEAFFLKAEQGQRFCLYNAPAPGTDHRGSFVYVHPFAEEMNKSRRMAALQAKAFASAGFGVLRIDLFGCGDSSGDFGDARWDIWKEDLLLAQQWLERRGNLRVGLWGLRMGALLALDFAISASDSIEQIVLWQPVVSGETFLTQFLRTRLASDMLATGEENSGGTKGMRVALAAGQSLEVAGYTLAPSLATSIDNKHASRLAVTGIPVRWFEVVSDAGRSMPPAATRTIDQWQQNGVGVHAELVTGIPFWATQEITDCPSLLTATTRMFDEALP